MQNSQDTAPGAATAEDAVAAHAAQAVTAPRPRSPASVLAGALRGGADAGGAMDGLAPVAILQQALERRTALSQAFWQLWLRHRDDLRRQSLRLSSGNFAEAEDALSEAMLKAAQAFPHSEIQNPRAWLLRLVHNSCIDRHREQRRREQAMRQHGDPEQGPAGIAPQRAHTPEELLASAQKLRDLRRALVSLPPSLAEPLMLFLDDCSDADIAARLRVTREVVRKRRQMARAWLRRRIA